MRGGSAITKPKRWSRKILAAAVTGMLATGLLLADEALTKEKIYPGVKVGPVSVGGQTPTEARVALQAAFGEFRAQETKFVLEQTQTTLRLGSLLDYHLETTLERALAAGRTGKLHQQIQERLRARTRTVIVDPEVLVNEETLKSLLHQAYASKQKLAQDAAFAFKFEKDQPLIIAVEPGQTGQIIDLESAAQLLKERAQKFSTEPVELKLISAAPKIIKAELEPLVPALQTLLSQPPVTLVTSARAWTISSARLASWIRPLRENGRVSIGFSPERITAWLDEIAAEVEKNPVEAAFELDPGQKKVTKFAVGSSGVKLPRQENSLRIEQALAASQPRIELLTTTLTPKIDSAEGAAEYGIQELLSRATTNFKGSPPNRVKNIKRGADILNGTLIAPNKEFSLLEHLRPFTLENGYLSELVIKASEGRTTPEIGGGLCQIGTTMFRTVLNAGLPVTARRNHSYRVSYYEPPVGMDATIYDPAPDFKFINDTGAWLLLATHTDVKKMEITFELWGTKDARQVEISEPEVSNFRKPPEKKIIETTDLAPGKIKCTERAHVGSDARFAYKITYPDGRVETQEFFSRYRPWQEVCLVGVAPAAPGAPAPDTAKPSDTLPSADVVGVVGDSNALQN